MSDTLKKLNQYGKDFFQNLTGEKRKEDFDEQKYTFLFSYFNNVYKKNSEQPGPVNAVKEPILGSGEYLIDAGKKPGTAFLLYKKNTEGPSTVEAKTLDEMLEGDERLNGLEKPEKPKLGFFSWLRHKLSFIFGEPDAVKEYDRQMAPRNAKKMEILKQEFGYDKFQHDADLTENAQQVNVKTEEPKEEQQVTAEIGEPKKEQQVNVKTEETKKETEPEKKTHQKTTIVDLNKAAAIKLLNRVGDKSYALTGANILIDMIKNDDPACGELVNKLSGIQANIDKIRNAKKSSAEQFEDVIKKIEKKVNVLCIGVAVKKENNKDVGQYLKENVEDIPSFAKDLQGDTPVNQINLNTGIPQIDNLQISISGK